jgi:hypothetical protein
MAITDYLTKGNATRKRATVGLGWADREKERKRERKKKEKEDSQLDEVYVWYGKSLGASVRSTVEQHAGERPICHSYRSLTKYRLQAGTGGQVDTVQYLSIACNSPARSPLLGTVESPQKRQSDRATCPYFVA